MSAVAPSPKIWKVTGVGTGNIAQLNTGGVTATHVGSGAATPNGVLNFGAVQAGSWTAHDAGNPPPVCLLFEWKNNTASGVHFNLYDHVADNTGVDFFGGDAAQNYQFRIKMLATYVDPMTMLAASIEGGSANGWLTLPHGATNLSLEPIRPNPGNDGVDSFLVGHNNNTGTIASPVANDVFLTNFFIYIAVKPGANADPGLHLQWGPRLTYVYPTV